MSRIELISGTAIPLVGNDIDTDRIIPARFLKAITFEGLGAEVFADDRAALGGAHPFDQPQYQGATLLVVNRNFGCGSSREHAPWALEDYGFRVLIAPSFADIFYNNSLKNGLLPVTLPEEVVNMLWDLVEEDPETVLSVDLKHQTVTLPDGQQHSFAIDPFRKICLLEGLDDLGYISSKEAAIAAYEAATPY